MTTSTLQHNDNKAVEVENRVIKKLFRRLITFLFVLFVFSFLDRINIGFAGLTMGKDLGLTSTMFGLAATLFYVTYVLCGIPSNIMLAKVGARRWIAGIMVVWGIASTCTMFATSPHTLYILRMLVGIAEAGFLPGILVYLTWWFPAYHRARANALFMIAMPVTMMLGSILSGYILALDGLWNLKGWQWLFLLEGLPSVVLGVVTWFFLNDTPDKANWLDNEEKQALKAMIDREREHAAIVPASPRSTLREVLTPAVLMYTLAYFCLTNTLSAINIWTPQILQSFNTGSSNIVIGLLAAMFVLRILRRIQSPHHRLQDAIENRDICVHYQPIVSLANGKIVGAEALARWPQTDGSWLSPDSFIPLAQQTGLSEPLTLLIIRSVFEDMGDWLRQHPQQHISINLESPVLTSEKIPQLLRDMINHYQVNPRQIALELTEREFADPKNSAPFIAKYRQAGHSIYIDDFGTGYSSLSYLQDLDVDILKIDKSFVDALEYKNVTPHIIEMAKTLKLKMVAEGIETSKQEEWLRQHGVHYGQGWLYSKALPKAEFILWAEKRL